MLNVGVLLGLLRRVDIQVTRVKLVCPCGNILSASLSMVTKYGIGDTGDQ